MDTLRWLASTFRVNCANAIANKIAFWVMILMMGAQNVLFFGLWAALFTRVSSLNGWGLREVGFLYGVGAFGYGIFFFFLGGLNIVAEIVASGQLDLYLSRPRPVLLSVLTQRVRSENLGDMFSGLAVILIFAPIERADIPLMLVLAFTSGLVFVSARLIAHTLVFWNMPSDTAEQGFMSFLIMATNPQKGFGMWGKALLLTLFPAGYVGLLPVEILRDFSWPLLALQIGGSLTVLLIAITLFHAGLKRYNSGNMNVTMR